MQPASGNASTTTPTGKVNKIEQAVDNIRSENDYDNVVKSLMAAGV